MKKKLFFFFDAKSRPEPKRAVPSGVIGRHQKKNREIGKEGELFGGEKLDEITRVTN